MSKKQRTSIYLDEQDRQAIQVIKERYGITSESDVIRFALRLIAREEGKPHVPGTPCEHRQDSPTR